VGEGGAGPWTQKALRQADQVLIVVHGAPDNRRNASEDLAFFTHDTNHRRLVVVHNRRLGSSGRTIASDTRRWLASRPVFQHHHVSVEDDADAGRLFRFLTGQAIGFVAAGGGGYGPAHTGIFKAFRERGVVFDIVGGTSVGASLMAGVAMLRTPEEIDDDTRDIFITSRSFKRRTFPRYSFLDHTALDDALYRATSGADIEDAWLPYFAVASDLSATAPYLFRSGPMWRAMRASAAIPGVLPPMFTDDGRMLVDGGLVDNIPLKPMQGLKSGPNVVVHFGLPAFEEFRVDYGAIPGRWPLLRRMLFARHKLPRVPGPVNVLRRSLFANPTFDQSWVGPLDLVLAPPPFPGSSFLDFDRHNDVFRASYDWARRQIDELIAAQDPAMAALLACSKP
jgi:NTE family protein